MEKFVIKKNILQHQIDQLQKIIINEKKWQKRNKNINLFIKNELEQTMFFFPNKIITVKIRQKELDIQKKNQLKKQKSNTKYLRGNKRFKKLEIAK